MLFNLHEATQAIRLAEGVNYATRTSLCLLDLPVEILAIVTKFCVVDSVPILDPTSVPMHSHRDLLHASFPKAGEADERRRTGRKESADMAVREARGMSKKERVTRSGICPNILAASKLFNDIGTRYLYESNTFMFTNMAALSCFRSKYPHAVKEIRHVQLFIHIRQRDAEHECRLARIAAVQDLPDGPWLSKAMDPHSWWWTKPELMYKCPFPWLKTLEIRFLDWLQTEAVNKNGTPYAKGVVMLDQDGLEYTNNPTEKELDLEIRVTQPIRMARGVDFTKKLADMTEYGWVAQEVKVTGCEEAQEYEALQQMVSDLSNATPKIAMIKGVPKADRHLFKAAMLTPWGSDMRRPATLLKRGS